MNPLYIVIGGSVILSLVVGIVLIFLTKPIRNIPFLYDKSPSATSKPKRNSVTKLDKD